MRVPFRLGVQSGEAASAVVSAERLVNAYLEQTPEGRSPTPIYGTPGLVEFSDTPIRAMLSLADKLWIVNATHLCEVSSSGVRTQRGAIPAGTVDISGDGVHVVVTCANEIYVWNGSTFGNVTDADAPPASAVDWTSGFFIFTETNTEQFFIAPMNDPDGNYDALDFDSSDVRPDKLVRPKMVGRTLLLFGKQSVEFWYYSGDEVFPFNRYGDDPIDVGLLGVQAAASTNETVFWLASDKTIRRLDGRTAARISTFAVEKEIESWSDASLTVATSHVYQGHLFIVFRNPDGCVVWDQATQRWHERQSYGSETWRVGYYAYAFGKHLFGGDKLYELGGWDEDGDYLPFEMVTPWLDNQGERFSVNEVELRVEAGVGTLTLDPAITLSRTTDGVEWSSPQIRRFGKSGERYRTVKFSRQGMTRGCAFKVRITDPVKRVIYAGYAEVE